MLNCREVTELCSRELERPLGLLDSVAVRTHLMMCSGCSEFRRQMRLLRGASEAFREGEANLPPTGPSGGTIPPR